MSWKKVSARSGRGSQWMYAVAGVATGLALMFVAYRVFLTFPATIEGQPQRLLVGTTVGDLFKDGRLHGSFGDLVAAKDHRVLRRGHGERPWASVNGRHAAFDVRLSAGDVVKGMNGGDLVEPVRKVDEAIGIPTKYLGDGPIQTVVTTGAPGLRELSIGVLSKEVASTRVVKRPTPRLVRRDQPTTGAKVVALTFDDGPWPTQTETILKILQHYGIRATFFEIGSQAKGRPNLSKELAAAGMLLGNHSESHPLNLAKMDAAHVAREIEQAEANITNASGQRPGFFRPPGGAMSPVIAAEIQKLGLKLVEWDVDTKDWTRPGEASIETNVISHVHPGDVILMHDGGGDRRDTIAALPRVIERLRAAGYSFVTLDALPSLPGRMG